MLMLYDRDEKLIACLKYNKIERKRELNGLNNLEFETSREVEYGQRTLFKDKKGLWNEYIIFDYFKNHENNDVTYSVYCEDSTSELYWYFIDDLKPRNATCSSILRRLLEGTRFEVGYVDDFPKKSFNLYRESVKSCLWKILDVYGAEINVRIIVDKTGIIHRYIDLRKKIGRDVGKRFTYKKDIGSIKKTTSIKDLCTALHGYGKGEEIVKEDGTPSRNDNKIGGGDYGRKIDFSEINGGKTYVEDNEARLKYGLGKERKHIFGQADFPDCEDKQELLRLTKEKLKELSKPKITYELKVEDISRYDGYIGEEVDLGDVVYVIDKEIDTRVQTRVISIKDNPIEEIEDSEIVLGNFIKDLSDNLVAYEKLKSTFENDRNKFNQELDKLANGVKSSYMQKILEKFNKELNETGGWVYAEEGEGLLILNAPKEGNPTQAINLKGGKIAIANHKNADGSFAYETFGDGDGFTANLIRAGVLRGGKVFFNLEDGTFLIGKSSNDYSMYWDGGTLHLRNVDIDLSNNYQIQNINHNINNLENQHSILSDRTDKGFNDIGVKIETVDKKIDIVSQDFKVGQGKFESSITAKMEGLSNVVENTRVSLDGKIETYNSNNLKTIGDLKSKISQTESSITSSVSSQIKIVNDKIDSKDSSLRSYVQNNYSTKTQTANLIESKVSSVSNSVSSLGSRISNAESKISQTANEISSKVSKYDFGTMIRQSATDIKFAWNNYSNYIQFEYGSIGIYDASISESKKRSMFDEDGIHFYRGGYYLGKIGTNELRSDSRKKGLVFDLDYEAYYMSWGVRVRKDDNDYTTIWAYANGNFDGLSYNTLNAGCDLDMNGHTLKNVSFEGGGISGTLNFQQIHSIASDGTAESWNSATLRFKNGILVEGAWN
ncbi:phage tail spike protein [Anaerococcus obesiensis]|uniref:phage tail spike protein n=1 Tax=Anaerococcus obesiensis TaxID=1287640 RepID=UPI0039918A4B